MQLSHTTERDIMPDAIELSDVIYQLEIAYDTLRGWKNSHPDDFLVGWAANTADAIKSQLDKVQA